MARDRTASRLRDTQCKNAKPGPKPYRLNDGGGLFLYVAPSGVKAWQHKYSINGESGTATLGKFPDVALADARKLAAKSRDHVAEGVDPVAVKRTAKAQRRAATAETFVKLSELWAKRESMRRKWSADYVEEVSASLRNHLSDLDLLPVGKITAAIIAPIMDKVERKAPDMATKVGPRLRGILDYAVERGLIPVNPMPATKRRPKADRRHLPAVTDEQGVGEVLRQAERAEACVGVKRAHLMSIYTAQRISEVVNATWDEFDLSANLWTIPRSRMKVKRESLGDHLVPIPPKFAAELKEWKRIDGDESKWVCPAPRGDGAVTREALEKWYRETLKLRDRHSQHSWRSVFSTWSYRHKEAGDAIEKQLDHLIGGKVQQAYDRDPRLEQRRELMARHEARLLAAHRGMQVIQGRRQG
jgi:integrase